MAKIERITVGYSVRMNQDYQSVEGSASLDIVIEEGELASKVMAMYRADLRTKVNKDVVKEMRIVLEEKDKLNAELIEAERLKKEQLKAERDAKLRLKEAA